MARKCYTHTPQNNPRHREAEAQNIYSQFYWSYSLVFYVEGAFCKHALYIILLGQVRKIFMYKRKLLRPGNATITDYRPIPNLKIWFSLRLQYMYDR